MLDRSSPKKYLSLHHNTHLLGLDGLGYFQNYNVFKDIYLCGHRSHFQLRNTS